MFNRFNENIKQIYLASCLYDCIEDNNVDAIETLLEKHCANPNIVLPDKGISPFHLIIGYPDETTAEKVTKLFLRYGGDSNVRSEDNMTPVHVAAAWGRKTILNLLLKCGGDVTLKDDDSKTAYDYAIAEEHFFVASLLQQFNDKSNQDIQKEYNTEEPKNMSTDYVNDYLKQLPNVELNSYVINWCARNAKANYQFQFEIGDDFVIDYNYYKKDELNQNADDFVTRRRKNRTFFSISDTIEKQNSKHSCNLIENITKNVNDLNFEEKIEIFNKALVCEKRNISEFDSEDKNFIELTGLKNNQIINDSSLINETRNASHDSQESGLCTILSNSSSFQNSLKPLCECKFIGEINPKSSESSEYATCEEFHSINLHEKNIFCSNSAILDVNNEPFVCKSKRDLNETYAVAKIESFNGTRSDSNKMCTMAKTETNSKIEVSNFSHMKENKNVNNLIVSSAIHFENETIVHVAEEYKYTDDEEGIVLIERQYLVTPQICINEGNNSSISMKNNSLSLPTTIDYDIETLKKELTYRGEPPGPITSTTKRVYLKRLMKLQRIENKNFTYSETSNRVYSIELEKTLRNPNWVDDLTVYKELESAVVRQFNEPDPAKKWREGISKASFTYFLMDPRVSQNLPLRAENMSIEESWKVFLSSIFYVGKGKRSRPYCHLYEAILHWNGETNRKLSKKTKHILDIWNESKGVVCLHIFQNVIPVEAYTREAAIISALKLQNLKNEKNGDFYGIAATWSQRQKKLLGVYLLYRALFIFLNEGERQLRPDDI